MAKTTQKKYQYKTKAIQLPDGTRKYLRGKTQEELDEKVLKAQILVNSGVDICSEETFGHFAQMWYDIYKKPYLRESSLNTSIFCRSLGDTACGIFPLCRSRLLWLPCRIRATLCSPKFWFCCGISFVQHRIMV